LFAVGRIISTNNTLPILNNILIKTENGVLKISSTNLEVAITTEVRCKVEEEGQTTVFAKTIIELVNNLPNQNITLESKENKLLIQTEHYHNEIKTLPAEEFPLIPEMEKNEILHVDAQELKKSIDQTVFAASSNQTQPEIMGVLLVVEGNTLRIAATDRYRLAEKIVVLEKDSGTRRESIIPQKTINELSRIIGPQKGKVEIIFGPTQASLSFENTKIISRLVEGQYPDYKQIIPTVFKITVVADKQELTGALKAVSIFNQQTNSVKLNYSAEKQLLTLSSESSELGKSDVVIPSKIEGGDGEIILNNRYVLDAVNNIETPSVVVKIIDDSSPSLVMPEKGSSYLYLVMPIKS